MAKKEFSKSIAVLLVLFVLSALLLTGINTVTAPLIEANGASAQFEPLFAVMPEAQNFDVLYSAQDPAAIEQAVLKNVSDGDVILLHDMSDSSVTAALHIIDQLAAQGYGFVTASELAALRGCIPKAGKTYTHFPPKT